MLLPQGTILPNFYFFSIFLQKLCCLKRLFIMQRGVGAAPPTPLCYFLLSSTPTIDTEPGKIKKFPSLLSPESLDDTAFGAVSSKLADKPGRGRRLRTLGLRFWRPPLYQLSYSPILTWWTVRDSNPGPTGYEPVALPTELTVRNSLEKYCRHDIVTAIPLLWRPL